MSYRPLDATVISGFSHSWINLGIWKDNCDDEPFEDACIRMADSVAKFAQIKKGDTVLDIGCGLGDSLLLWKTVYECSQVVGVNVTSQECVKARFKVQEFSDISVIQSDAIDYIRSLPEQSFDTIVAVDSLYHVNSRRAFLNNVIKVLKPGGRFAAVDIFGTTNLNIQDPNDFTKIFALRLLSFFGGIPLQNLMYNSDALCNNKAFHVEQCEIVTDSVLMPFSRHMYKKASRKFKSGRLYDAVYLLLAAAFMHLIAWTKLVEVTIYAISVPPLE